MRSVPVAVACVLTLLCGATPAQTPESWKLTGVKIVGSKQCTSEEVVRASGLSAGAKVSPDDLKKAAQRLAETGAFTDVRFEYQTTGTDASVTYTVKDANDQLPVRFENFVWTEDEVLDRHLRDTVPLFHGSVSQRGRMAQDVADALARWLAGRGLPGQVVHRFHAVGVDEGGGSSAIDAVSYVVEGVSIPVREVRFENAPSLTAEERSQIAQLLVSSSYQRTKFFESAALRIGPVYSKKGRLRARLAPPRARLAGSDAAKPEVIVTCAIEEGLAYKIASVRFTQSLPPDVTDAIHATPSAVADALVLMQDIADLKLRLTRQGYLEARSRSDYDFHDDTGTVDYVLDVVPGPRFHMGTVRFEGFSPGVKERLTRRWKLETGDPYDSGYFDEFIQENSDAFAGRRFSPRKNVTPDHTIDLTIQLL